MCVPMLASAVMGTYAMMMPHKPHAGAGKHRRELGPSAAFTLYSCGAASMQPGPGLC